MAVHFPDSSALLDGGALSVQGYSPSGCWGGLSPQGNHTGADSSLCRVPLDSQMGHYLEGILDPQ